MLYRHGSFTSEDGEWSLRGFVATRVRNARNRPQYERRVLSTSFCIVRDGQADIKSRFDAIYQGLRQDGVNSGFLHDGGQPSLLYLPNAGSVSGVQVVQLPSIEARNGADYATGLEGSFSVQADYTTSEDSNVLDYRESVTTQGSGLGLKSLIVTDTGQPLIVQTSAYSHCRATQSGYLVTSGAWGIPNPPIWSDLLVNPSSAVTYEAPTFNGNELTGFRVAWNYEFISDGPLTGQKPSIR